MKAGMREVFRRRQDHAPTAARRAILGALVLLAALPVAGNYASADTTPNEEQQRGPDGHRTAHRPGPAREASPPMEAELERLSAAETERLGDQFAGNSWGTDGILTFGVVEGATPSPAVANHPKVRVVTRKFSGARLTVAMDTVTDRLNKLLAPGKAPGTSGTWPFQADVKTVESDDNVVLVLVGRDHEPKRPLIEAALRDEIEEGTVRLSFGDVEHTSTTCASRYDCSFPFRAGTHNVGQANCTTGFVMKDWAGVRFQTTAAHCPGRQPWPYWHRHSNWDMGHDHWTQQWGRVDLKIIRQQNQAQNAPANFLYRNALNTALPINTKNTDPTEPQSYRACSIGYVTNENCGTIGATSVSRGGLSNLGQLNVNVACKGDSGAPVVHQDTNRAYGMNALANIPDGFDCITGVAYYYFTWVRWFEEASGHQVLLTPTTETLGPGQRMHAFDRIQSTDGRFDLKMQNDGNLVLYHGSTALWDSGTWGNPGAFLSMQNDGNLVIYTTNGTPIWSRGCCVGGTRLVVQNDANVVMYQPNGGVSWARTWG